MKFPIIPLLLVFTPAFMLDVSVAQLSRDREYVDDVHSKLQQEVSVLQAQKFRPYGKELIEPIATAKARRVPFQLDAGATYAIIAACDKDCDHVQVALLDEAGVRLIESPEKQQIVIISGTPTTAGPYTIELTVPGCKEKTCHAGIIVTRQETAMGVVEPGVPPPKAEKPRSAAEFNGYWTISWTGGSNCRFKNGTYALRLQNGQIVGGRTTTGEPWSGSVSVSGAARWSASNSYGPLHYSGKLSGNSGSGRFSNSNCTGTFVARRT